MVLIKTQYFPNNISLLSKNKYFLWRINPTEYTWNCLLPVHQRVQCPINVLSNSQVCPWSGFYITCKPSEIKVYKLNQFKVFVVFMTCYIFMQNENFSGHQSQSGDLLQLFFICHRHEACVNKWTFLTSWKLHAIGQFFANLVWCIFGVRGT